GVGGADGRWEPRDHDERGGADDDHAVSAAGGAGQGSDPGGAEAEGGVSQELFVLAGGGEPAQGCGRGDGSCDGLQGDHHGEWDAGIFFFGADGADVLWVGRWAVRTATLCR